jgi:hypothetical protein
MSSLPTPTSTSVTSSTASPQLPGEITLRNAATIAMRDDKPIMLDYYTNSINGSAVIGVRGNGDKQEKMLVKSQDEYTSSIVKTFKCGTDYIVVTENSIYIVSATIPTRLVK